jgi:hypothetical protein
MQLGMGKLVCIKSFKIKKIIKKPLECKFNKRTTKEDIQNKRKITI